MPVPFKPRTVHPLAQSLHPLRYASSIQHSLQACWKAKLIIQQEIRRTVTSTSWPLELCSLVIARHAACFWAPTICRLLSWPCHVIYYLYMTDNQYIGMEQSCTDWPTLQRNEFLTIRTAVMVVQPIAVSRSAAPLRSSVITRRPLDEGQAFP
jgi:hypothetical protein